MKTESKKSSAGKIASWAIAALVLVGAAGIWAVADVSAKSSLTSKAFVFFISAVIVVQVVPGIMLLGAMLKGVCSIASKKVAVTAGADRK
jgi:membrane protein YdbS with pleckstrin-like domain